MTALRRKPGSPTRHADPDAAITAYLEELRQAGVAGAATPAAALNGLGDAHLDKGDVVSAVDYYRQAAEVYGREGMHDHAIACCKKIRRYAPDDIGVGLMLGRYYAASGLRADAVAELEAYAERQARTGRRREAIEALRDVARLAPERAARRERLARLLAEEGRREEALVHFRAALEAYQREGDEVGAEQARASIIALGTEVESVSPPAPPSGVKAWASGSAPVRPGGELEIERTAYDEREVPRAVEPFAATRESSRAEPEGAKRLAHGHRDAGRWPEAVTAYRRLAELGLATPADFDAWTECARQVGEASKVLEALAVSARWHLERDHREAARRAAEEMLLIDPDNAMATDILARLGASVPRG